MYNFIFDADALIKLTHSSALLKICKIFNCITTMDVKRETIDEGKKRFYPDVDLIEDLIKNQLIIIKNPKKSIEPISDLGKGELSVLSLTKEIKSYIVVSDDQKFIKELEKENLDFLVPTDLIILLKKLNKINQNEAIECLEKIKAFIREEDFKKTKKELGGK